jgi:hypothetical protein
MVLDRIFMVLVDLWLPISMLTIRIIIWYILVMWLMYFIVIVICIFFFAMFFNLLNIVLILMMGPCDCEGTHQGVLGSSSHFIHRCYLAHHNREGYQIPQLKVKYDSTNPFLLLIILLYSSYLCWTISKGILYNLV